MGKPGPHSRGGQARCQYRHLVCPWGTHRETGEWVHVKAMEGCEGGEGVSRHSCCSFVMVTVIATRVLGCPIVGDTTI